MLLTIVSFIFVLGIVVFFHELGHFLAAKAFGVRVHRFSLGFPPKMIGFKKGETEYCISWIPLGGYVKMEGENPAENAENDEEDIKNDPGNLLNKPAWQRAIVFFAGPFANLYYGNLNCRRPVLLHWQYRGRSRQSCDWQCGGGFACRSGWIETG